MAMNMMVQGLLAAGHTVKVLAVNSFKYSIRAEDIPAAYAADTGIRLIDVDLRIRILPALLNLFTGKSYHIQRFISKAFRNELTQTLKSERFDIVQLETLFMAPYLDTIRRYSDAKVFLRAHNIEHLIWQRVAETTSNPLKRRYVRHLAHTLRRYELGVLTKFDGIIAITPTDAAFLRSAIPDDRQQTVPVTDIPFGIDLRDFPPSGIGQEFPSLYTIGAMNWIPNQEGIRWFLHEVWPDVHERFPGIKYYIAGREMPEWMRELKLPGVVVAGEVEDARQFIASKSIMIAPLFSGSGIRVKIIEGMAAGKAVVSTTIGAEGIRCTNREEILLANLPCEFFEMISVCASDRTLCQRIGANARRLVEQEYNQPVLIEKLVAFYQHVSG